MVEETGVDFELMLFEELGTNGQMTIRPGSKESISPEVSDEIQYQCLAGGAIGVSNGDAYGILYANMSSNKLGVYR